MQFLTAFHTDVGIRKETNQDASLILKASTDFGDVLMAVVCDGMGGLAKGEVASASLTYALSNWFQTEFPSILYEGLNSDRLRVSWERLVDQANRCISEYAEKLHVNMGTTCVVLLIVGEIYYILNVGDSRVYLLSDDIYQLTKDQTYVQREVDAHHMTYAQAQFDPHRNILLQCVGASEEVAPDYYSGKLTAGQCFLLCSDGFRHMLEPWELYQRLSPAAASSAEQMQEQLRILTDINKQRQETDNITAILIRTY